MSAHPNPLLARFMGVAAACLVSVDAHAHAQLDVCLNQAHLELSTPEFAQVQKDAAAAGDDFWSFQPDSYLAYLRPYVVKDGVLQIPVKGVLLHDFPYALGRWATGYEYVWQAFKRGMGDLNVKGIALVCDTPGGMVAGCFEAVDKMFALKQEVGKEVRGYAAESAYSAGYAVISVCDTITVSKTGGVGSIGVVTGHLDVSGAMDKAGLKFTFIYAGQHKVDGNAYEPLPADVKTRIQARIDALYDVFVSTVARNRPALTEEAARATEALTYTASEAVSNKLADNIGALDDSLAEYAADLESDEGDDTMSTQDRSVSQADHDTAVTNARTEGHAAGLAAGKDEGATAERARISTILASDEGKKRPIAAMSTAMKTAMSVEDATAFLASLPEEKAPEAAAPEKPEGASKETPFDSAMRESGGGSGVKPADGSGGDNANDVNDASGVLALARSMGLPLAPEKKS